MAQHLPDLRLAAQAADRRHLARERCGVGYPGAGLALAEAAVEDELHVETADRGGRMEHLGLDPAGTVPGRLAARRRIQREHQPAAARSEEHTSELQSLMRISYAVFCLKKNKTLTKKQHKPKQ